MPSIWETDKLFLFIAFVIPGFVMLKAYGQLIPGPTTDSSKLIVDAIAYSCVNYALLAYPILLVETHGIRTTYPNLYVLFLVFALLLAPILWACIYKWVRSHDKLKGYLPHPVGRPWDYVFGQGKPYWVIVTYSDGTKIGGMYASKSFTSSAPFPEQIYLEETWELNSDDGFERPKSETAGVLVISSEIQSVEFFQMTFGDNNE